MKTIPIEISQARSLEHAMEKAIEEAERACSNKEFNATHRVDKVTFKTLVASVSYRDSHFTYSFEAELEEL